MKQTDSMKETFIGEAITPEDMSFSVSPMAAGKPGLPRTFSWKGRRFSVLQVLEEWKEAGDCRHGSGERYVRKHWFRVRTTEELEMKIYFERQGRSSGGSRWRLYSMRNTEPCAAADDGSAPPVGSSITEQTSSAN
jgi:phosphoribosylglycinamide formyltransferase-1